MKTNRTNSFRLHRISNTNSLKKSSRTFYQPDESLKLAAINSVTRGVKHADLSFLTGHDLNKLRVEPLEPNEGVYNAAHDNLKEVRKKYDDLKKLTLKLDDKISKMKDEINKYSIFTGEYDGKIKEGKDKVMELQKRLEDIRSLLEITSTQKKVLLSMEMRHKQDKVFYDQKKFDLEKELSYLRKQLNIFKRQGLQIGESEDRTTDVYEKLAKELERQAFEREQHIRNLECMIEEKQQLANSNQAREMDLYEIAQRAIQDKDYNEKQWRQIFLTNTFVNRMLRNKIEKEMQKFRVVEFAFKEIKTATGVSDAKTLVTKYLNKETVYGQLLGKIAENEKTIESLKSETDKLIREEKQLEMQLEVLQSVKIKSQDLHENIKSLQQSDLKSVISETYQTKMGQWLVRQLKKLSAIDKKHEELEAPKTKEKIVELFQKYLGIISKAVEQIQVEDNMQRDTSQAFTVKENQRIVRIIPKRARKNSIGEEIFDVDQEETLPSANLEEQEIINTQREDLLRANDKFMKDLKRKKEEERKLLIDKTDTKKEKAVKAPEPKKEED